MFIFAHFTPYFHYTRNTVTGSNLFLYKISASISVYHLVMLIFFLLLGMIKYCAKDLGRFKKMLLRLSHIDSE